MSDNSQQNKKEDNLSSSAIKTAIGNFASRFFGLFRDILLARFFGTSTIMSAFITALTIPNLSRRIFGEGALTASFIPLLSDRLKNEKDAVQFASIVLSVTVVLTSFLTVIGIIISFILSFLLSGKNALIAEMTGWLLPYMVFICLSAQLSGILNLKKSFTLAALSAVLFNIFLIIGCFLTVYVGENPKYKIYILVLAVLLSGIVQLALLYKAILGKGFKLSWRPEFKSTEWQSVQKLLLPGILGASVAQISVVMDRVMALWIGDHAVSALYFAERLIYFPVGIFGVALGVACLPYMSKAVSDNNHEELMSSFAFGLRQVCYLTVPCAVIFYFFRTEIIDLVYKRGAFDQESLKHSVTALLWYLPGIPAFSAVKVILPLYYAQKDVKTPVKISLICLVVNVILGICFIPVLSHGSLAMATSVSSYLNVFLLIGMCGHKDVWGTLTKSCWPLFRVVFCALIAGWLVNSLYWQKDISGQLELCMVLFVKIGIYSSLFVTLHLLLGGIELKEILLRKKIDKFHNKKVAKLAS